METDPVGSPPAANTDVAAPESDGSWVKPGDPMLRRDPAMAIWGLSRRLHARG